MKVMKILYSAILLTKLIGCFIATQAITSTGSGISQSVKIVVQKETLTNKVRYRYQVINGSREEVVAINVGFDFASYKAELRIKPIGYEVASGAISRGARSPRGWKCRLITQEESSGHYFEWAIISSGQKGILPQKSKSGFALELPQADSSYETGHFEVILRNSVRVTGNLTPISNIKR